ncbi:hypothetical protein LMH87_010917 [Akanthomyces muscarius]|uniref:Nucleic acid-binding, OB-fold protein n=1 Tax=Akanthomyces muscarius TaxID=2231603 RepID=A0A9W8QA97_AKAMU|nr:hypothetical protein LMH87_010917 [Akanthomyces muscarius]KAJ4150152.1 hypothetical protein LMH87_010917 [Akanthomyces muscarius]
MPPRVLLLAGAPSPSLLDEEKCTIQNFAEPFREFIKPAGDDAASSSSSHRPSPASIAPMWRSLSLHRKPLHTGFSQAHNFLDLSFHGAYKDDGFFCPSSLTSSHGGDDAARPESDEAAFGEFCEQSLAIHNSLPSSQLDDGENTTTTFLDETSFLSTSTTTTNAAGAPPRPAAPDIPPAHLSDLEDVPSARQVISLQPQTVTLNIIVGILSIAQPRSVTTRWCQTLSLVEVLLGDDTRSGFAVTFWLSKEAAASGDLLSLRRQDVILLQNVALHVFRGRVYGQSLRRGQTKVHLLWSKRKDARASYTSKALAAATADGADNPQLVKTKVVRDWVIQYVGTDPEVKGQNKHKVWDRPPEDTQ